MGVLADQLRSTLRTVAVYDAKALRATNEMLTEVRAQIAAADAPLLTGSQSDAIADAIALLQANGYTVTPPTA